MHVLDQAEDVHPGLEAIARATEQVQVGKPSDELVAGAPDPEIDHQAVADAPRQSGCTACDRLTPVLTQPIIGSSKMREHSARWCSR